MVSPRVRGKTGTGRRHALVVFALLVGVLFVLARPRQVVAAQGRKRGTRAVSNGPISAAKQSGCPGPLLAAVVERDEKAGALVAVDTRDLRLVELLVRGG